MRHALVLNYALLFSVDTLGTELAPAGRLTFCMTCWSRTSCLCNYDERCMQVMRIFHRERGSNARESGIAPFGGSVEL